ncbi:MAG: hypothetical protein OXB84_02295, partial [Halobacteriovoraceae bacterium]|nr:hypothetical protein [Halobacteriovoraceae bacterium]
MNRINKFLILFTLSVFVIVGIVQKVLQSDKMASLISKKITKDISKVFNANVKFEKMEIKIFPPATIFKQVKITGTGKNKRRMLEVNVESFGVYFGLIDFFFNKTPIGKVRIEDGELITFLTNNSTDKVHKNENSKVKISSVFEKYQQEFIEEMPIELSKVEMSKVDTNIDGNKFLVEECILKLLNDKLILNLSTENINIQHNHELISMINGKSMDLDVLFKKKYLEIKNLKVEDKLNSYTYKGKVYEQNDEIILKGKARYEGGVGDLMKLTGEDMELIGFTESVFNLDGNVKNLKVSYDIDIKEFESEWGKFQNVSLKGVKKENHLIIKSLKVLDKESFAESVGETILYDYNTKKILQNGIKVKLSNFFTNKALYTVRDSLNMLKGYISGEVKAYYKNNVISFNFDHGAEIKNFFVINEKQKEGPPILKNSKVKIDKGSVDILENGSVDIDLKLLVENSVLEMKGNIDDEKMLLESKKNFVNLESIGPIAGVKLKGKGNLKFKVSGKYPNIKFFFDSSLNNAFVPEYNLGSLNSSLIYELDKNILRISRMKGVKDASRYNGNGFLNFANKDILLNIKFNDSYYVDLFNIYEGLFKNIDIPRDISLIYNTSYKVSGKMKKDKIKVEGSIEGRELLYMDQDIDSFRGDFTFVKDKLLFKKGVFKKNKGILKLETNYNFIDKKFNYDINFSGYQLYDINFYKKLNLGYDSIISGYVKGYNSKNKKSLKSKISFAKGVVKDTNIDDSFISISNENSRIYVRGNLLGDIINIDSHLDLTRKNNSYINATMMADDIRVLAGFLSPHNIDNKYLKGLLSARVNSKFKWNNLSNISLSFSLDEFLLKKKQMSLISKDKNKILIEKGLIKNWNILLQGENAWISSKGSGNFSNNYDINTNFKLKGDIFELISPWIQKTEGDLKGRHSIKGTGKNYNMRFSSKGKINSLKIKKIPRFFSNVEYSMLMDNREVILENLKGEYGEGIIEMDGNIGLEIPYPKINLNFLLDNSYIPIIKKSGVVVSGNGKISGEKMPYLISGNFSVLRGNVIDEFQEITSNNKGQMEHSKYIPQIVV